MNEIVVKGSDIIILAILVLAVGNVITQKISLLRKFSIPIAVTGGLLCSIAVALIAPRNGCYSRCNCQHDCDHWQIRSFFQGIPNRAPRRRVLYRPAQRHSDQVLHRASATAASTATRGLRSSAVSCEAISVSMTWMSPVRWNQGLISAL